LVSREPLWDAEGAIEVVDGIHRLPLPLNGDNLRAINVYAIDGGDGIDLVDSGAVGAQGLDALQRGLRQIGRDLCDIKSIVCTHLHYDHYSLGLRLRRDFGIPLSLPEGEQPALHTQCSVSSPMERRFVLW
jgi:glyoxylase-like metal-dependent hydrolase (beta-lactamase superfamily II)